MHLCEVSQVSSNQDCVTFFHGIEHLSLRYITCIFIINNVPVLLCHYGISHI